MKRFLPIISLILFCSIGICQKIKTKPSNTFKIKKEPCVVAFNGIYWEDTVTIAELLTVDKIELIGDCKDSAKIVNFDLTIGSEMGGLTLNSQSAFFTPEMINAIKHYGEAVMIQGYVRRLKDGITISNVKYRSSDGAGQLYELTNNIILYVDLTNNRNKQHAFPSICLAAIGGSWADKDMSKEDLIQIGKLNLMGDYPDSSKILGFTLILDECGYYSSLISTNEYLTHEMIDRIKKSNCLTFIWFHNIRFRSPNGRVQRLNTLSIRMD